ncbi:MAG: hypothetical protein MI757_18565, partial [Pirellulales bacterium]|nr:hypothetical protein [Pirellulales bacterium]
MNCTKVLCLIAALTLVSGTTVSGSEVRSNAHEKFAKTIWDYVQSRNYRDWPSPSETVKFSTGPTTSEKVKQYVNSVAQASIGNPLDGAVVVTENLADDGETVTGISIWRKLAEGANPKDKDWYWIHYVPDGKVVSTAADKNPHARRGFATWIEDGRLWVFDIHSKELADYKKAGDLAKHVILPGAGPLGMTVKSPDKETALRYTTHKPGFKTFIVDGRVWVFAEDSPQIAKFKEHGELAKQVIRPGGGPQGMTIKSEDAATIDKYMNDKPGFVTAVVDGRLWIFRPGSEDLAEFKKNGEPAKSVTFPNAGRRGMTLKAPDRETILAYLAAVDGFETFIDDGRVWVFKKG